MLDPDDYMIALKHKQPENPFIDQQPSPRQTLVDMKGKIQNNLDHYSIIINDFLFCALLDVMVLNDIIEQAAGRDSKQSERGKDQPHFVHRFSVCLALFQMQAHFVFSYVCLYNIALLFLHIIYFCMRFVLLQRICVTQIYVSKYGKSKYSLSRLIYLPLQPFAQRYAVLDLNVVIFALPACLT